MSSINDIRQMNFLLLRAVQFTTSQEGFGRAVGLSQNVVSQIEGKKRVISSYLARKLEKEFSLPIDWMDRDNAGLMLSSDEFALVNCVRNIPESIRQPLLLFIGALEVRTD